MKLSRWWRVDGVLLLDKSEGMTSNAALQRARRLFSAARAGHTGTLDPMATGLLPLCFGEASKFSSDLLEADKTYEAKIALGATTTTGDREGVVTATHPVACAEAEIAAILPRFVGDIQQIPPMYSALKREGRPLYELARAGKTVERQPRRVTIQVLERIAWETPYLTIRVTCGKGTYIRVLAEDIGAALGCGAHLAALRRTRVGALEVGAARDLSALEALSETERQNCLAPVDSLMFSLPAVMLDAEAARRFGHGNPVAASPSAFGKHRVYCQTQTPEALLGMGVIEADGLLWPRRLVVSSD